MPTVSSISLKMLFGGGQISHKSLRSQTAAKFNNFAPESNGGTGRQDDPFLLSTLGVCCYTLGRFKVTCTNFYSKRMTCLDEKMMKD